MAERQDSEDEKVTFLKCSEHSKPNKVRNDEGDDKSIILELPPPPDGGWGWVILFASFMAAFLVHGITYSFGVFLDALAQDFDASRSKIAWAGSLLVGIKEFIGPLVSGLTNRFGCRPIIITGAIVSAVAFALTTVSRSPSCLIFMYSLAGAGFGLIYLPCIVSISYYFEDKRAMTSYIAACGSGIGMLALAPLAQYLLDSIGWTGANLVFAGAIATCLIYGALVRPLEAVPISQEDNRELYIVTQIEERRATLASLNTIGNPLVKPPTHPSVAFSLSNTSSVTTAYSEASRPSITTMELTHMEEEPSSEDTELTKEEAHHTIQETIEEEEEEEEPTEKEEDEDQKAEAHEEEKTLRFKDDEDDNDGRPKIVYENEEANDHKVLQRFVSAPVKPRVARSFKSRRRRTRASPKQIDRVVKDLEGMSPGAISIYSVDRRMSCFDLPPTEKSVCVRVMDTPRVQQSVRRRTIVSPLSRKDTFYTGSVKRLKKQHSSTSSLPYRQSILKFNPVANIQIEDTASEKKQRKWPSLFIHESCWNIILHMVDLSLLKNSTFLIITFVNFLVSLGVYIPFIYLVDAAVTEGVEANTAAFLISLIGIAHTIGRGLTSAISSVRFIDPFMVYNVSILTAGLCISAFGFATYYTSFYAVAAFYGLSSAGILALHPIILVDLLGLDKLTSSYGLISLFRGFAAMIGAPIAGGIFDLSGKYGAAFYFGGGLVILAAIIGFILEIKVKCFDNKRRYNS